MRKFILCLSVAALVCLLIACLGFFYPLDLLFNLVAGWAFYCYRVLPLVRPSVAGILTALVCLGGLACGAHLFLRWLSGQLQASKQIKGEVLRSWPARRTVALLALIIMMFVAGISAVGMTHQTAWLVTSPEPLVADTRSSAARTQLLNNLKQMALAMIEYSDTNGVLPPAATWDDDGRALLSWRVLILPYLEHEALYKHFHLNEPWDSPGNIRLLPQMPSIYAPLSHNNVPNPCRTFCQVFTGPGTPFEGRRGLSLKKDFPNGWANTFLIVEAAQAVPWTKPEDLPYSASQLVRPLGYLIPDSFAAALADGTIRRVERTESEQTIRALITRNGGEGQAPDR